MVAKGIRTQTRSIASLAFNCWATALHKLSKGQLINILYGVKQLLISAQI